MFSLNSDMWYNLMVRLIGLDKKVLREQFRKVRDEVSNKKKKSLAICDRIINCEAFKRAKVIALYANTSSEVETDRLLESALKSEKVVLYPKVCGKEIMNFYRVRSKRDLVVGKFGILEPVSSKEFLKDEIDLFIVPGLAFDRKMNRLGYGGGYYDSYLEEVDAIKMGIAFSSQICGRLDAFPHDVKLDYVVTEEEIIS